MKRSAVMILAVLLFVTGFACTGLNKNAPPPTSPPPAIAVPVGATLLEGMGAFRSSFATGKPETQRWFDQALILTYGFNHDAAERSFLKAVEIDPDCAMCWWGAALVLGPHVNAAMDPANSGKAWMRVQKALALASKASAKDQAFIRALSARYADPSLGGPPADRKPLDEAYAAAMEQVVQQFPDDLDAATLYAEALMDLQPWDYWDDRNGTTKGNIAEIVAALESVKTRNSDHIGALHLYIHAVEASRDPDRGAVAADRLRELVPGSGHLVHMPAHIYTRVGRYHDAVVANQKAIASDDTYLATCRPAPGVYPLGYVPHNHHFLWWASTMEGASARALAAAEETAKRAWIPDMIKAPGFEFLQDFWVTPLKAKVQLGRWDEVVATAMPPEDMPYPVAVWHFAQGMAAVRQARLDAAGKHLDELVKGAANPVMEKMFVGPRHPLSYGLKIAERVLTGELAAARKDYQRAIASLEMAVEMEDGLPYFEPALWHHPVRQTLGAVLLKAKKSAAAENVYREDLKRNRENGWSLYGLAQSLKAQKKTKQAAKVEEQYKKAWQHADITLTASVL